MNHRIFKYSFFFAFYLGISSFGFSQGGLFKSKEPLAIEMKFSLKQLKTETDDSTFMDSQLIFESAPGQMDTVDIEIRTRGNFRLANCFYPPMRLKMKKKEVENTVFQGDRSLKLVLPCSKGKSADSFVGKEYLAYQLYEDIADYTFRTRMLTVKLTNTDDKKNGTVELLGFFIEDDDEVADRFDGKILDDRKIIPTLMADTATVRHDFFQFMIGNTDWSGLFQHNEKVLLIGEKTIVPLAYDFDMTGLVNPPYSQVNNNIAIEHVTDRLYRGFCRDPELMQAVRVEILGKEKQIYETVDRNQKYFDESAYKSARLYLKEFFDILRSDKMFQQKILKECRSTTAAQTF